MTFCVHTIVTCDTRCQYAHPVLRFARGQPAMDTLQVPIPAPCKNNFRLIRIQFLTAHAPFPDAGNARPDRTRRSGIASKGGRPASRDTSYGGTTPAAARQRRGAHCKRQQPLRFHRQGEARPGEQILKVSTEPRPPAIQPLSLSPYAVTISQADPPQEEYKWPE